MTGKQLEKALKIRLKEYFEVLNYSYEHIYQNTYFKNNKGELQIILEIQSLNYSIGGFSTFGLTFWNIEEILKEIGLPNASKEVIEEWYPYRKSIIDSNFSNHLVRNSSGVVESIDELEIFCESIITYMETAGKAFVERYSYLPHILEEMDKNTREGINWSYGVFSGTAGAFFKGLLISKLCNDVNFNEKIELVDNIYYPVEHNLQEFIPYYEKLKERLKTVEPIYNC